LLTAGAASADPLDLALNRLSLYNTRDPITGTADSFALQGGCGSSLSMYARCEPDNVLFANLVNQLGGALAPGLLAPSGTVGYNGLYFAYEHSLSNINADPTDAPNAYWRRGTEGPTDNTFNNMGERGTTAIRNRMGNAVFVSRFHIRKALPLGFELGLQASWLHDSGIVALGADIRWSLFEGFHSGAFQYLPDFAVRGAVNTVVGQQQLYLTVITADAMLSKAIPLGGVMTLTPFLGGQGLIIFGDSTVIDGTPTRSSYQECARRHVNFYDAMGYSPPVGPAVRSDLGCDGGSAVGQPPPTLPPGRQNDSFNDMVFMPTRIVRFRGFGGLRLRAGIFTFTAEFGMDASPPIWLNGDSSVAGQGVNRSGTMRTDVKIDGQDGSSNPGFRQWMVSIGVGVTF